MVRISSASCSQITEENNKTVASFVLGISPFPVIFGVVSRIMSSRQSNTAALVLKPLALGVKASLKRIHCDTSFSTLLLGHSVLHRHQNPTAKLQSCTRHRFHMRLPKRQGTRNTLLNCMLRLS